MVSNNLIILESYHVLIKYIALKLNFPLNISPTQLKPYLHGRSRPLQWPLTEGERKWREN